MVSPVSSVSLDRPHQLGLRHPAAACDVELLGAVHQLFLAALGERAPWVAGALGALVFGAPLFATVLVHRTRGDFLGTPHRVPAFALALLDVLVLALVLV